MANMFAPSALDELVKERAEELRRQGDDSEYVPEWVALVDLLGDDVQERFLDRHDGTTGTIDIIAEATDESPKGVEYDE